MLKILFELVDGSTIRRFAQYGALAVLAAIFGLFALVFAIAAIHAAIALAVGGLYAWLICAGGSLFAALLAFLIGRTRWRNRPRPLLARARYAMATEALSLARVLLRKEPAKVLIAAMVLGAIAEHLQTRDKKDSPAQASGASEADG